MAWRNNMNCQEELTPMSEHTGETNIMTLKSAVFESHGCDWAADVPALATVEALPLKVPSVSAEVVVLHLSLLISTAAVFICLFM
jgi:hypothetical protein